MSFINATLWNDLQADQATNEKRFSPLGLVDSVKESSSAVNFIPPSYVQQMNQLSSLRSLQLPVIKDQSVVVTTSPGFSIPSNLEESANYSFQAFDVFSGFRHYPGAYKNNQLDAEYAVREKMKNISYAMGQAIEGVVAAQMELRKSQTLGFTTQASTAGTIAFNAGTDTLEVDLAAQNDTMFFNLEHLMDANDIGGDYHLVTNRGGLIRQRAAAMKYGVSNEKNLAGLGFLPENRLHESGSISPGSDIFNGFMFRNGSLGFIENFPYDFVNGTEIAGAKWSISDVELPFTRMRANIYTNKLAANATGVITSGVDSNLQMGHFEEMAIWHRFYLVYEYNSDLATRPSTVTKIKGLTTTV